MEEIYQKMWQENFPLLKDGKISMNPFIEQKADLRRGLTLRFKIPDSVLSSLQTLIDQIKKIEPFQYYYPPSDIHLTVLTIISCHPEYNSNQIPLLNYQNIIGNILRQFSSFRLSFKGLTASPASIMVKGYDDGMLNQIRNELRLVFKNSSLLHTIDSRYKLQTAHFTIIRFKERLNHPKKIYDLIEKHLNTFWSTCQVSELELVVNDWYHRKENVHKIGVIQLY